ncbi:MAG TPA: acetylxylan esterase, partial [Sumerlaeia bacterium]|nr:acetylxylan esterase [Sumerlaeia bacterium]
KVAFESRPNHHVTANLYLPSTGKRPCPSVLVPCGHSPNGKAYPSYQSACVLLAKNGFAALIVDPICQGERYQFLDASGKPATGGGTMAHTLLDVGAKLVGSGSVAYEAWDNIRAVDYLVSRPEVDPTRIGCTGNSGGGTQTTFLMALDDRINVAAPACYLMTREAVFDTIGPADGCQHLANEGLHGIEQGDYIAMRAPKPTIILAAERDFFDINATSVAFREAKRLYAVLGFAARVDLFAADEEHGFGKPLRQAAVWWMRRWLLDDDSPVVEPELNLQKEQDLWVTETGQVGSHWKGEVTVADLNLRRAKELAPERARFWKDNGRAECLAEVKRLIGFRDERTTLSVETKGAIAREDCRVEKLLIQRAGQTPVPALLFLPKGKSGKLPAILYVDGRGKRVEAVPGGAASKLASQGRVVLSIDARGFGETTDDPSEGHAKYWNCEHRNAMIAMHIGRPLLGQRVEDVLDALEALVAREDVDKGRIQIVGIGQAGPVALHAAAIDERFGEATIDRSIASWIDLVAAPLGHDHLTHVVPFALTRYDLPDLVRAIAPRKVRVIRPVDGYGKPREETAAASRDH